MFHNIIRFYEHIMAYVPKFMKYTFSMDEIGVLSPDKLMWNFRARTTDGALGANHETVTAKVCGIHRPTCPEDWRKGFVKKFSSSHFEFLWEDDPSKCKTFATFGELMTFLKTVTSGTKL